MVKMATVNRRRASSAERRRPSDSVHASRATAQWRQKSQQVNQSLRELSGKAIKQCLRHTEEIERW